MKHSRADGAPEGAPSLLAQLGPACLVILDVTGRLALPGALLALTYGAASPAVIGSGIAAVAASARGFLLGLYTELLLGETWRRVVVAARRMPIAVLRAREPGDVGALIAAVQNAALDRARTGPRLVALAITAVVLGIAVVAILGAPWLLFGAVAAAVPGVLVALGRKRVKGSYERAWRGFQGASRDASVLLEASVELRAHGREGLFVKSLLRGVDTMNQEHRVVTSLEAVLVLVPASLGALAVAIPFRAGLAWATNFAGSSASLARVGILGGAALATVLAFVQAAASGLSAAPHRRTVQAFVDAASGAHVDTRPDASDDDAGRPLTRSIADAVIELEAVSCVHEGAEIATPMDVSLRWADRGGLALVGANGAGKSTLALVLVGLLSPTRGRVRIDDVDLGEIERQSYRARITFVPQGPFYAPSESIAWHMRLFGTDDMTDATIDVALHEVGLYDVLEARAGREGVPVRDVHAGKLSGGERQRMHLARAVAEDRELVLLDEPEAALDARGRASLRELLERLSEKRKVLLIAHDPSVIPASFRRVECARGLKR